LFFNVIPFQAAAKVGIGGQIQESLLDLVADTSERPNSMKTRYLRGNWPFWK